MRAVFVLFSLAFVSLSFGDVTVSIQTKTGFIVDIKESVKKGAKLLGGYQVKASEACVQQCQDNVACDMAVYKTEGLSESGRNCYLVACGTEGMCVTAEHEGFVTSFLSKNTKKQSDDKSSNGNMQDLFKDKFSSSEKEDTDSAKQDSKDVSQNSQTQDSEKVDAGSKSASENQQKTEKMEKTDAKDVSSSSHSEKSEKAHTVSETDAVDKNAEKQDSKDKVADKESTDKDSEDAVVQNALDNLKEEFKKMGTDKDGEVGIQEIGEGDKKSSSKSAGITQTSDSTAGTVVGVVLGGCFLILVVSTVMGITMRKAWSAYKRRKYKQMDYLINGMYS